MTDPRVGLDLFSAIKASAEGVARIVAGLGPLVLRLIEAAE